LSSALSSALSWSVVLMHSCKHARIQATRIISCLHVWKVRKQNKTWVWKTRNEYKSICSSWIDAYMHACMQNMACTLCMHVWSVLCMNESIMLALCLHVKMLGRPTCVCLLFMLACIPVSVHWHKENMHVVYSCVHVLQAVCACHAFMYGVKKHGIRIC
jgi:hypothetical protein